MSTVHKVCPVVFRDPSMRQILAFEHPRHGVQLVKGGVEPGESVRAAALRVGDGVFQPVARNSPMK